MIFLAALLGFVFGHLVHLVFDRFFSGEPLRGPLYECPACRSPIRAISAVPYASVILHGGRCPNCREKLPWRAVILPAGAAALFALSYFVFDDFGAGLLGGFFATVFLTLTLTDLERRLLPNRIVYPSILFALAFCWAWPDTSWMQILAGGAVGVGIAVLIYLFSLLFDRLGKLSVEGDQLDDSVMGPGHIMLELGLELVQLGEQAPCIQRTSHAAVCDVEHLQLTKQLEPLGLSFTEAGRRFLQIVDPLGKPYGPIPFAGPFLQVLSSPYAFCDPTLQGLSVVQMLLALMAPAIRIEQSCTMLFGPPLSFL